MSEVHSRRATFTRIDIIALHVCNKRGRYIRDTFRNTAAAAAINANVRFY